MPSSLAHSKRLSLLTLPYLHSQTTSPLVDDSMIEKVALVCPNIGIVYSGMGPDFRVLVSKARKSAQAYWKIYQEYPPTRVLVAEIASIMQSATQSG